MMTSKVYYNTAEACKGADITVRQLNYWVSQGAIEQIVAHREISQLPLDDRAAAIRSDKLLHPNRTPGSGHSHFYEGAQVIRAWAISKLIKAGMEYHSAVESINELAEGPDWSKLFDDSPVEALPDLDIELEIKLVS